MMNASVLHGNRTKANKTEPGGGA